MVNRINTHKKDIINNIFNTIGIPSSYASKLVDELILIIISALITKKKLKIKNFGTFSLKKKKKELVEIQKIKLLMKF